jgi:hypothetical protein
MKEKTIKVNNIKDPMQIEADVKYSEFLIPSGDAQGHSVGLSFKLPKEWVNQINTILLSRKFPYKSTGYFMRHAVLKLFEYLERLETIPGSTIAQIRSMIDLMEEDAKQQGFELALDKLSERVAYYTGRGETNRAAGFVLHFYHKTDDIMEDYWREYIQKALKQRFGKLLESIPDVDFSEGEEDPDEITEDDR